MVKVIKKFIKRKVLETDLELIRRWRNQKKVRDLFLTNHVINKTEHLRWWKKFKKDKSKFIWIIESNSIPVGVIQIYNYDRDKKQCWWSAHLGDNTEKLKLNTFTLWCQIEEEIIKISKNLNCEQILCESLKKNKFVINLHERFGYQHFAKEERKIGKKKEIVIVMTKNLKIKKSVLIFGSSNWDLAVEKFKKSLSKKINFEFNVQTIPYGQNNLFVRENKKKIKTNFDIIFACKKLEDFQKNPFSFYSEEKNKEIYDNFLLWKEELKLLRNKISGNLYILSFYPFPDIRISMNYGETFSKNKFIDKLNNELIKFSKKLYDTEIISLDRIVKKIGTQNASSEKYFNIARIPFSNFVFEEIAKEISRFEISKLGLGYKVIVTDLDGVIWGGIIGDDGIMGIELNYDFPGNVYIQIQEALKTLSKRGIILTVCSKNNEKIVRDAFKNHQNMVLKSKNIVNWKVNWKSKVENIKEIAKKLSIDLSAFCFLDNSPYERDLVKKQLPQVNVFDWPNDINLIPQMLLSHPYLQISRLTKEDKLRKDFYKKQVFIENFKKNFTSRKDYLKSLKMKVDICKVNKKLHPRVFQLFAKTNQFNSTTRRHNEQSLKKLIKERADIYDVRIEDKFSKKEIIGVINLMNLEKTIKIESFVMSCRFLGRDIEKAIISFVVSKAKKLNKKGILGDFIKTDRNSPVREFYEDMNFKKSNGGYFLKISEKLENDLKQQVSFVNIKYY
tara:strand:+ start:192 stop:2381 length:2190 start_codon:yes stop_codon:yes gene_type:complete